MWNLDQNNNKTPKKKKYGRQVSVITSLFTDLARAMDSVTLQ